MMAITNEQLIARAQALQPVLAERAAATEAARAPLDETIADLIEAGIIQMLVPGEWGGPESDLPTMFRVVEEIGSACVSTAWIAAFYINHNIYPLRMDGRLQEEMLGQRGYCLLPAATSPTMRVERVPGGWKIDGRASWGSGIMQADWVLVSGMTGDGPYTFALPHDEVRMDDVWHYAGMAGTGSNDIVLEGAFVPDYRSIASTEFRGGRTAGSERYANPLYSIPMLPLAYCTVVGVLAGGLRGAMREYATLVERRVRNFSGTVVKDQQHAHVMLGEFHIATGVAHDMAAHIIGLTNDILHSRPFTRDDRLLLKGKLAFLSKHCRDTVNAMMSNAGASSYHLDQPLQRFWRDLNTVCSHAFWDWDATRELTGRDILGLELSHPLL